MYIISYPDISLSGQNNSRGQSHHTLENQPPSPVLLSKVLLKGPFVSKNVYCSTQRWSNMNNTELEILWQHLVNLNTR